MNGQKNIKLLIPFSKFWIIWNIKSDLFLILFYKFLELF